MASNARPDVELAARWLAYLLIAAAVATFAALVVLPVPDRVERGTSAIVGGAALACAVGTFALRRRMPAAAIPLVFLPCATVAVTVAIKVWGSSASDLGMLYVWVVIYAAYFLTPRQAAMQLALVALAYGLVLQSVDAGDEGFTRWGATIGTLVVATLVTSYLVQRLRRENAVQRRTVAERERLMGILETAALTDELTGLPNRRAFDGQLDREVARAGRSGTPLCVGMLDLDHFKQVNDLHGHSAGDRLLRECGAAWSGELRGSDILARHGGDEFTLLLPDCDEPSAFALVERLRAATPLGQTVSTGIAEWDGTEGADALLARADGALYEAKAAGRDRALAAEVPSRA